MTDGPLTRIDDAVLWHDYDSVRIGSANGHVYLPPEEATPQAALVVHIAATDDIEGRLWKHGWSHPKGLLTDVIDIERRVLTANNREPIVRLYSVLFANDTEDRYRDDFERHFRVANYSIDRRRP